MTTVANSLGRAPAVPADERREANARTQPLRFVAVLAQLGLLFAMFKVFRIENDAFLLMSAMLIGTFAVHYWLPMRAKEPFWIGASMAGAYALLSPLAATALIGAGLGIFGLLRLPIAFRYRLALILAVGAAAIFGRATLGFGLPSQFWQVFGALFMFRLAVYVYDLSHAKKPANLKEFLGYFFMLPNYTFLLFPVVDFQTLRKCYYQRDIHVLAQQGVQWILRGAIQLLLYRLIYNLKPPLRPEAVTSLGGLLLAMFTTYLLYLRVSGQFHIVIGMLHLFGYDLPETHRKYLLSNSITDFWRRINIYWKDFMVKMVYFPLHFKLRKKGEVRAQIIATLVVFLATWALHSYQWFWITGNVLLSWPDAAFWAVLGALVTVNLLLERKRKPLKGAAATPSWSVNALKVATTLALITVLWALWNSPSVGQFFDLLTYWQVG